MNTNPKATEAFNAGMGLFNQKKFELAFEQFSRARKLAPKNFEAVYLAGISLYRLERFDPAQKLLSQALLLNPHNAELLNTLGNVFGRLARPLSAIKSYRKAIAVQPDYTPAYVNLGKKLSETGNVKEAFEVLIKAYNKEPSNAQLALIIADIYIVRKQFKSAEKYLDRVERLSGISDLVDFRRLSIQVACSKFTGIERRFSDFENAYGASIEFAQLKAKYLFEAGKITEAKSYIQTRLSKSPDSFLMSLYLKLEGLKSTRDQFLGLVKEVVSMSSANSDYSLIAIEHLMLTDDVQNSLVLYEQLPKAQSQSIRGLMLGTSIYENLPDGLSRAVQLAQKASNQNSEYEGAAICLARVLLRSGKFKKARDLVAFWRSHNSESQFWLAYEATVSRCINIKKYNELCNYESMVQVYELEIPAGYDSIEEFNAKLATALTSLHGFSEAPLDQSLRSGTQSIRSLEFEKIPVIQEYIKALGKTIRAYIDHLKQFENIDLGQRVTDDFVMQGCWSVRLKKGGRHVNHVHPEGWISSAYYVQTPSLEVDGQDGWIKFGEPPFPIDGFDSVERWIKPEAGKLVLFPSYFWHGVSPVKSDEIRITAPFDIVPSLPA